MPGGPVADAVFADLVPRIEKLIANGHTPGLGTILVGDDGASAGYVRMKMEKAAELGSTAPHVHLPETRPRPTSSPPSARSTTTPRSTRFLVQHPTPPQIDFEAALLEMDPDKDVDGMHPVNMGRLALMMPGPVPCTPAGIEALLALYEIPVAGHEVCILGRAPRSAVRSRCCSRRSGRRPTPRSPSCTPASPTGPSTRGGRGSSSRRPACPGSSSPSTSRPGAVVVGGGVRYEGRKLLPDVDERARRSPARSRHGSAASARPPSPCCSATPSKRPSATWRRRAQSPPHDRRARPRGGRVAGGIVPAVRRTGRCPRLALPQLQPVPGRGRDLGPGPSIRRSIWFWAAGLLVIYLVVLAIVVAAS